MTLRWRYVTVTVQYTDTDKKTRPGKATGNSIQWVVLLALSHLEGSRSCAISTQPQRRRATHDTLHTCNTLSSRCITGEARSVNYQPADAAPPVLLPLQLLLLLLCAGRC